MSFPKTLSWWLLSCTLLAPAARSVAQESEGPLETDKGRGYLFDGYDPYLELLEAVYVPPAKRGEKEMVRLRLSVVPEIPDGTVFSFTLEYGGLDYVTTDYTLKGGERKNLTLEWKPEIKLAEGDYFLRSRMHLAKQSPTVQALMQRDTKRFPPIVEPWPYLYMTDELTISVDSPLNDPEQKKRLWSAYEAYIGELASSMSEFTAKMETFQGGTGLTPGDKVDVGPIKEYAFQWHAKHEETQKKILEFQLKEPALFAGSRSAFLCLRDLGRMVSKRARDLLKDVLAKNGDKAADLYKRWPARDYPFRVERETLERQKERILTLIDHPKVSESSKESSPKEAVPEQPGTPPPSPSPPVPPTPEPEKPGDSPDPKGAVL